MSDRARRRKRWPPVAASSGLLLLVAFACTSPEDRPKPNVVLVVVDALRRDHLGLYGYPELTSPFIDWLGARGVVYDDAYAHSSHTLYSTAALFTSSETPLLDRNLDFVPVPGEPEAMQAMFAETPALSAANDTVAETFSSAGFETVGIFTNPHHHPSSGFGQGFDSYHFLPSESSRGTSGHPYAIGDRVNAAFREWIRARSDADRPYFAYLHYMDVHNPYAPPKPFRQRFVVHWGQDRYQNGIPTGDEVPSEQDLRFMTELYDAEIRYVDVLLDELVAILERASGTRETLFVLTSDHGDEFMDHGGLGHGQTLEPEMLEVPLLSVWLGREAAPSRVPGLIGGCEVPAILYAAAGVPVDAPAACRPDGTGDLPPHHAWVPPGLRSVVDEVWYFIDGQPGGSRLYDRVQDPEGAEDLSDVQREVVDQQQERLRRFARKQAAAEAAAARAQDASRPAIDPEAAEQLRALGYGQ